MKVFRAILPQHHSKGHLLIIRWMLLIMATFSSGSGLAIDNLDITSQDGYISYSEPSLSFITIIWVG